MGEELLYHYCSTETFLNIIQNKSIRLSSMKMSNDSSEGIWVSNLISDYIENGGMGFSKIEMKLIHMFLSDYQDIFPSLAFCLSREGDLLSQWRGYADDGYGFCIGFDKGYILKKICDSDTYLEEIKYVSKDNLKIIREYIRPAVDVIRGMHITDKFKLDDCYEILAGAKISGISDVDSRRDEIFSSLMDVGARLFTFKNPAFREEGEWRIVRSFSDYASCSFSAKRDRIVPFQIVNITNINEMIRSITCGPRHLEDETTMKILLESNEIYDAEVKISTASYR